MVNKEERKQYAAALGKQGGKNRAKKMTPEERSEAARQAVQVRWATYRANQKKGGNQ